MNRWGSAILLAALAAGGLFACKKPDPVAEHREKGDEQFNNEQWEAAAAEYTLSLEGDPKQEKVWEKKAGALMNAGKTDEAAQALLKLLDFASSSKEKSEVYRKTANVYLQVKKADQAEKYFLEAVKVDPSDFDAINWLGEIASTRGGARAAQLGAVPEHLEKAIAYYDKAIAINPNAVIPYVNKRIALFKWYTYEQRLKQQAENDVRAAKGNRAKAEEAKAAIAQHDARATQLKTQIDELGTKIAELQKAQKAAAAAASAKPN